MPWQGLILGRVITSLAQDVMHSSHRMGSAPLTTRSLHLCILLEWARILYGTLGLGSRIGMAEYSRDHHFKIQIIDIAQHESA